jgi:hypothetical protein
MTVKIEPELLHRIQVLSDEEEISVSHYVRKALIQYIREVENEISPRSLRVDLTLMETHVLTQLIRIGAITEPQELFHKSFDSYLSHDLERTLSFAGRLKDMREFPSTVPLTTRVSGKSNLDELDENDDLEGDADDKV